MTFVIKGKYDELREIVLESLTADQITLLSFTVQNFLEAMLDELKRAGVENLEMLEKSEIFLRSVTPEYDADGFVTLLNILKQVDSSFYNSKFYYSFSSLRILCNKHHEDNISFMRAIGMQGNTDTAYAATMLSLHLITNTILFIQSARKIESIKNITVDALRYYISNNFHNCLASILMQRVSMQAKT